MAIPERDLSPALNECLKGSGNVLEELGEGTSVRACLSHRRLFSVNEQPLCHFCQCLCVPMCAS